MYLTSVLIKQCAELYHYNAKMGVITPYQSRLDKFTPSRIVSAQHVCSTVHLPQTNKGGVIHAF